MSEHDALLRAILERPDDDLPRLVYADWLEEHADDPCPRCFGEGDGVDTTGCSACESTGVARGRAERAEFIRVQCELAQDDADDDRNGRLGTNPLRRRERELLGEKGGRICRRCDWHAPLPHGGFEWEFRRGFVAEVRLPLAALVGGSCGRCGLQRVLNPNLSRPRDVSGCTLCSGTGRTPGVAADLFAAQPVERVTLSDCRPGQWPADGNLSDRAWMGPRFQDCHPIHTDVLPGELFDRLPTDGLTEYVPASKDNMAVRAYRDTAAALDALSAACVAYGRSVAKDCWHGVCEACDGYGKPGHIPETRQTWAGWRKCPACDGTGKRRGLPPLTSAEEAAT